MDEPTQFDKIAEQFWTLPSSATVRSEAEDERPSPVASNLTLSATQNLKIVRYRAADRDGNEAKITPKGRPRRGEARSAE